MFLQNEFMQFLCQLKGSLEKYFHARTIPEFLFFIWPTLLIFLSRYAVIILGICTIWTISHFIRACKKEPLNINQLKMMINSLQKNMNGRNRFEFILNIYFIAISLLDYWRPYPSFDVEMRMTFLILGGMIWWYGAYHYASTQKLRQALTFGCLLAFGVLVLEAIMGHPWLNQVNRSVAQHYAILALSHSIFLWIIIQNSNVLLKIILSLFYSSVIYFFLDCDTAIVGVILGIIAYMIGHVNKTWVWRSIQVKICIIVLTLPLIFHHFISLTTIEKANDILPSFTYIHRLHIWKYASDKIMEEFWNGYGLNAASRKNKLSDAPYTFTFQDKDNTKTVIKLKKIASHQHNMIIQWWLEWGLIGAIWWCGILWAVIDRIRCLPRKTRPAIFAFFASNMSIILFSINFWQGWWWATWMLLIPILRNNETTQHS